VKIESGDDDLITTVVDETKAAILCAQCLSGAPASRYARRAAHGLCPDPHGSTAPLDPGNRHQPATRVRHHSPVRRLVLLDPGSWPSSSLWWPRGFGSAWWGSSASR